MFDLLRGAVRDKKLAQKTLIVHVGQHKTGSTAIQRACARCKDLGDFYYPLAGRLHAGHHEIPKVAQTAGSAQKLLIRQLLDEAASTRYNNIVISSEFFSSRNELIFDEKYTRRSLNFIADLGQYFGNLKIVFYIRDQVSSIDSRISQAIKSRLSLTSPDWRPVLENVSLKYDYFLEFLQSSNPGAELVARIYDRSVMVGADVRKDFFESLGISIDSDRLPVEISNEKLTSAESIFLSLLINELEIKKDMRQKLKAILGGAFEKSFYTMISSDDALRIIEFYEASNRNFEQMCPGETCLPEEFYEIRDRSFKYFGEAVEAEFVIKKMLETIGDKARDF